VGPGCLARMTLSEGNVSLGIKQVNRGVPNVLTGRSANIWKRSRHPWKADMSGMSRAVRVRTQFTLQASEQRRDLLTEYAF
jgi:hypothetical protein